MNLLINFFTFRPALPAALPPHIVGINDPRPETDQSPHARPTCAGTTIRRAADRQQVRGQLPTCPWPQWGEDLDMSYNHV